VTKGRPLREIGTVPTEKNARDLEDHLLTRQIATKVVEGKNGWSIWIRDEDRVPQAAEELRAFLKNPDDPLYHSSRETARSIKKTKAKTDKEYQKKVRDLRDNWEGPSWRRLPATSALVFACIVVAFLTHLGEGDTATRRAIVFSIVDYTFVVSDEGNVTARVVSHGLDEIREGEIWRLVTPIFLHIGPLHLLFNMSALIFFGGKIEYEKGKAKFLLLVLVAAIVSNCAQYLYNSYGQTPAEFGGMSGVIYALFGYMWIKGETRPEEHLGVSQNNILMMLGWFLLCMTGRIGPIANAAHGAGLIVGLLIGATRF
jgi:GlpG protein